MKRNTREYREHRREYMKLWRIKDKLSGFSKQKQYREKNKEKRAVQTKIWKSRHPEKVRQYRNEWLKKTRSENKLFVFHSGISALIRYYLKHDKNKRLQFLNYFVSDLKVRLESKFNKKMNWENYGSYWEIDHIKPLSRFGDKDYLDAWKLDNLQPLEANKNRIKGNKF